MVFHMKTTLTIDDNIMKKLKEEAAKRNTTITQLVESALRLMLVPNRGEKTKIAPLPIFDLGRTYVDISDRDSLYQAMEGR